MLAAHLRMTATRMTAEMPAEEWDVWLAFMELFPLGPRQEDFRAAVVAASLGGKEVLDLFPSLKPPPDRGGRAFRAWALGRAPGWTPGGKEGE